MSARTVAKYPQTILVNFGFFGMSINVLQSQMCIRVHFGNDILWTTAMANAENSVPSIEQGLKEAHN